jgi:hypothetical protein
MLCPHCSVGDIPDGSDTCSLCGTTASAKVIVESSADKTLQAVQEALADYFRITGILSIGERSFVYTAEHIADERPVALKVIPVPGGVPNDVAQRFARQAGLAASLGHAQIVPLYQRGSHGSFVWYAMEHVRARPLAQVLKDDGPMRLSQLCRIVDEVAVALDHAHRQSVLHGNLKPSNIFVDPAGWIRVSDFAVIEALCPPIVRRPEYMAPEQLLGQPVGPRADQYALAVVAFQCLTGERPFVGDSPAEIAELHEAGTSPDIRDRLPDLPEYAAQAIHRALSRNPPKRFPSVLDFASVLSLRSRPSRPAALAIAPREPGTEPFVLVGDLGRGRLWRWIGKGLLAAALATAVFYYGPARLLEDARGLVNRVPEVLALLTHETAEPPVVAPAPDTDPESTIPEPSAAAALQVPAEVRESPPTPAASPPPRNQVAREPAQLFVNARPWGELYVDGELLGNTPKAGIAIPPGRHVIRVTRDGFVPYERTLEVSPGEEVRLTDIVLVPRRDP